VRFNIKYDPLVHENTEGGGPWLTTDSTEVFIHGILSAKRTGTCSSLPTFSIAVGRRLGYPLKLVLVPNHTLYRWDGEDEVFNLQPSDAGGFTPTNEYFYEWPRKWDEIDYAINERTHVWLHSMTPRQEVSKFLCNRAILLREIGRHGDALDAIDAAERFNPINPACEEIRLGILHQMPDQAYVQPMLPTAVPITIGSTQTCIDPRSEELFGQMVAILSHRIDYQQPHARAGGNGNFPKTQIRNSRS